MQQKKKVCINRLPIKVWAHFSFDDPKNVNWTPDLIHLQSTFHFTNFYLNSFAGIAWVVEHDTFSKSLL